MSAAYLTPLEPRPDLAEEIDVANFSVKRDDLQSFYGGGSKARRIDALCADPKAQAAAHWIVYGGAHSNHIRLIASVAAQLGKRCTAMVFDANGQVDSPNLRLARWAGCDIVVADAATVFDQQRALRAAGRETDSGPQFVVPASRREDVEAYRSGGRELQTQLAGPAMVVFAAGTGSTAAGVLAGLDSSSAIDACLISVHLSAAQLQTACQRHWQSIGFRPSNAMRVTYHDEFVAPGYGTVSTESAAATEWAARRGLLVDPIYTGRALAGLLAQVKTSPERQSLHVVLWHSGGTPITSGLDPASSHSVS